MRAVLLTLLVLLAGCLEQDDAPLASAALGKDPDRGVETLAGEVKISAVIENWVEAGVNARPNVGIGKHARLVVPGDGAATAVMTATWAAANPTSRELVFWIVGDDELTELGRGTSPLAIDVAEAFGRAGEHVVAANPVTGASLQETIRLEVVLTYA